VERVGKGGGSLQVFRVGGGTGGWQMDIVTRIGRVEVADVAGGRIQAAAAASGMGGVCVWCCVCSPLPSSPVRQHNIDYQGIATMLTSQ
jgi:hypothetical protein